MNHEKLLLAEVSSLAMEDDSHKLRYWVLTTCLDAVLLFISLLLYLKISNLWCDLGAIILLIGIGYSPIQCHCLCKKYEKKCIQKENKVMKKYKMKNN